MRSAASLAERYHEATKYTPERLGRHADLDFAAQPSPFKDWYQAQVVVLPGGARGAGRPSKGPLDLERLGRLLHHTYGVTRVSQGPGGSHHFRASPSAGALYPAELYVAVHGVAGVANGIYDYLPREHALALCWEGDFRAELARYAFGHPAVAGARVVLVATGVFRRSAWRYQDRAYRRVLLDTGHMLANAVLAAPADGLRVVPVADFLDDGIDGLLLLEPEQEGSLLLGAVLEETSPVPAPRTPRRSHIERGGTDPAEGAWIRALHDASRLRDDEPARDVDAVPDAPPGGDPVPLPAEPLPEGAAAQEAIRRRRSTRQFRTSTFPLADVGRILAHALGREAPVLAPGLLATRVVVAGVEGLASGVYAYEPARHDLRLVRLGDPRGALFDACLQQELGRDCAFAVVRSFDLPAAVERYGERAYRYAHLQAGLDGERLDLAALRLSRGASGIGGFFDEFLTGLVGLPPEHAVAYLTTIGTAA